MPGTDITPADIDGFLTALAAALGQVSDAIDANNLALAQGPASITATVTAIADQPARPRNVAAPDVLANGPITLAVNPTTPIDADEYVPQGIPHRPRPERSASDLLMLTGGLDLDPLEIQRIYNQVYERFSKTTFRQQARAPPPPTLPS